MGGSGGAAGREVRPSLVVTTDFPRGSGSLGGEGEGDGQETVGSSGKGAERGIVSLPVDYAPLKRQVLKAKDVMDFEREGKCTVCGEELEHEGGVFTVCRGEGCDGVAHLGCLGKRFLEEEEREGGKEGGEENVVPIQGSCPHCGEVMRWVDVVKDVTLRMRGEKEVERLLRVKKTRGKGKGKTSAEKVIADTEDDESLDEDAGTEGEQDVEELDSLRDLNPKGTVGLGDGWPSLSEEDDSDLESIASSIAPSQSQAKTKTKKPTKKSVKKTSSKKPSPKKRKLATVIEDSEDDIEIID